jgi:o-succinylbenzoate synthase
MNISFRKEKLKFKTPAATSRGSYSEKEIVLVEVNDSESGRTGIGECSPLPDLSTDGKSYTDDNLLDLVERANKSSINPDEFKEYPAFRFALEAALKDIQTEGKGVLFKTEFSDSKRSIPVNGLIWMSDVQNMREQVMSKIEQGFDVIKLKIGSLDFDEECRLLEQVRKIPVSQEIQLRVDANGAFENDFALEKIRELSRFDIHSIEQPIKQGQWDLMQEICAKARIDVALDEELIGINDFESKEKLIKTIKPPYLILKPSLLGGFASCDEWVNLSSKWESDWWVTSALESNVGLNAIAQWVSTYPIKLAQGLGTGALFENNFEMGLKVENGQMYRELNSSNKIDYNL